MIEINVGRRNQKHLGVKLILNISRQVGQQHLFSGGSIYRGDKYGSSVPSHLSASSPVNHIAVHAVIKVVGLSPFEVEGVCSGAGQICHQGPSRTSDISENRESG